MSEIDEIVGEFLVESYENLDQYDEDLLALERDPTDTEVLSSIFRTIHTIKGTCGFFGYERLEAVAHVAENLLGRLREGELQVTSEITSALLATGDALRAMLADIEATGEEGDLDNTELVATLERLNAGEPAGDATAEVPSGDQVDAAADADGATPAATTEQPDQDPAPADDADDASDTEPEGTRLGEMLVGDGKAQSEDVSFALYNQELGDDRPLGEILVEEDKVPETEVASALANQAATRGVADSSIRVDVGLLDDLMNLVGELVLARNQIMQLVGEDQDSAFTSSSQRLNLITTELQEGVMKTRMQPIGNVWNKLPRVVRDLSMSVDKEVHLEMVGQDTELDKTIIEAIKDPLTHLVRNAVDHGLEAPEAREAAGKAREGRLTLRAFHEGGQVNIEIADDGAGIDAERIKAKAVERGVITSGQAAAMGEREALHLVFAAGFSTAEAVTNVSGRGVGMDVVRTNIERIGGTVDVHTEVGAGTTFKVKIPLTLAIIPALVVSSGEDRYAIPQLSLLELVRLEGEQARTRIEMLHGVPVYRLRGKLLPIVSLDEELGRADATGTDRDVLNIVVLQADGHQFGLLVDEINDTQEIVVKPLGSRLKEASLFAGATIMGDGRVALILDVLGTAQRAKVVSESRERTASQYDDEQVAEDERTTLLLVGLGEDRRAVVPLSSVARLEEFEVDAIEYAGGREVVQYRGEILPLVRLGEAIGVPGARSGDTMDVVVHAHGDRHVGLVVGDILDIVEDRLPTTGDPKGRPGVLGSMVIHDRVTDVVDVGAIVGPPPGGRDADLLAGAGADLYAGA